jgi:hypothetical protein
MRAHGATPAAVASHWSSTTSRGPLARAPRRKSWARRRASPHGPDGRSGRRRRRAGCGSVSRCTMPLVTRRDTPTTPPAVYNAQLSTPPDYPSCRSASSGVHRRHPCLTFAWSLSRGQHPAPDPGTPAPTAGPFCVTFVCFVTPRRLHEGALPRLANTKQTKLTKEGGSRPHLAVRGGPDEVRDRTGPAAAGVLGHGPGEPSLLQRMSGLVEPGLRHVASEHL